MSHIHQALSKELTYQSKDLSYRGDPSPSPWEMPPLITALKRRKRVFLIVFSVFTVLSSAYILTLPTRYEAELKLLVKNERQDLVIGPESNTNIVRSSEPSEADINSEIELLRSRDVLRQVALASGLTTPEPGTTKQAESVSPLLVEKALTGLEHDLSIVAVKKSNIIDVTYLSKDPQLASGVLTTLANDFLEAHLRIHGTPGSYAFFDAQANEYKERLRQSEDRLRDFQRQNSSLVQPDQDRELTARTMESQASLEGVDAQIQEYKKRIEQNQQLLATLDARVVTQVRTVPQAQLVGNLNQTLIELKNKRTELMTKFRPDDRMVLETDSQITDTTAALQDALKQSSTEKQTDANPVRQEVEKDLTASRVALAGFEARQQVLASTFGGYQRKMLDLAGAAVQHDQLLRQVRENENNYLLYAKKREEARIAESLDAQRITNVAIVQAPITPVQPSGPKIKLDLLLTIICAAFVAFIAVFVFEYLAVKPNIVAEPLQSLSATR
jgi:uncharacterized protein involved in exopolysaccharide biosynthesis